MIFCAATPFSLRMNAPEAKPCSGHILFVTPPFSVRMNVMPPLRILHRVHLPHALQVFVVVSTATCGTFMTDIGALNDIVGSLTIVILVVPVFLLGLFCVGPIFWMWRIGMFLVLITGIFLMCAGLEYTDNMVPDLQCLFNFSPLIGKVPEHRIMFG